MKNNCENFFKRKQTKHFSQLFFTKFFTTVFHNHFHGVKMFFTTSTRLHCGPTRRELGLPESSSDSARRRGGGEHATAQHTHTHTLDVKVRSVFLSIAGFFTAPGTRGGNIAYSSNAPVHLTTTERGSETSTRPAQTPVRTNQARLCFAY